MIGIQLAKKLTGVNRHENFLTYSVTKFCEILRVRGFVVTVEPSCEAGPRRRAQKVMLMAQTYRWQ